MLRNSLDHGIEYPELRLKKGKEAYGTISIQCRINSSFQAIEISVQDNGQGIDLAKLRQKAIIEGILDEKALEDPQSIAMCIFKQGFSSRHVVSTISGRGVGMSEIKRLIELAGGTLRMIPQNFPTWREAGDGINGPIPFTIVIQFPTD